jgi:hypothetical protein
MYNETSREHYFKMQKKFKKDYADMKQRHKELPPGLNRTNVMFKDFYFGGVVPLIPPRPNVRYQSSHLTVMSSYINHVHIVFIYVISVDSDGFTISYVVK